MLSFYQLLLPSIGVFLSTVHDSKRLWNERRDVRTEAAEISSLLAQSKSLLDEAMDGSEEEDFNDGRTKSISAIDTEIAKINDRLVNLQKRQDRLTRRLQEQLKQKCEYEARQIMDAFQKSSKSLQEMMKFLEV